LWHCPGHRSAGRRILRASPPPRRHRRGAAARRDWPGRCDSSRLPGWLGHGGSQNPRDGDHRRAGTDSSKPLHWRDRLPWPGRRQRLQHRHPDDDRRGEPSQLPARGRYRGRFTSPRRIRGDPAQGAGDARRDRAKGRFLMIWVRGRIVPDDALAISVLDRTFEHGLGLFETLRTWSGQPTLLPRHLDRLTRSAAELGLPHDREALPDREAVRALLAADGREADAMLWMRSFALPPAAPAGVILGPAGPVRVDVLASHKTLNHWPNRIMYENARGGGFDECVTISPDGNLWEGSRSNLFVVMEDQ